MGRLLMFEVMKAYEDGKGSIQEKLCFSFYFHIHNSQNTSLPVTKYVCLLPHRPTPAKCPAIQFRSGTIYLDFASDLIGQELNPTKLVPLQTPAAGISDQQAINRGSHNSLLGLDNSLECLTKRGEKLAYRYLFTTKNINRQMKKHIGQGRGNGVWIFCTHSGHAAFLAPS